MMEGLWETVWLTLGVMGVWIGVVVWVLVDAYRAGDL
jgi:hypothetical protein